MCYKPFPFRIESNKYWIIQFALCWGFIMGILACFVYDDNRINVLNTFRPRQNGRHLPDDIFIWNFLNDFVKISIRWSLTFVPRGQNDNIPSLVQIMTWRRPGDKSSSESIMVSLLTRKCVTRPQWINANTLDYFTVSEKTLKDMDDVKTGIFKNL